MTNTFDVFIIVMFVFGAIGIFGTGTIRYRLGFDGDMSIFEVLFKLKEKSEPCININIIEHPPVQEEIVKAFISGGNTGCKDKTLSRDLVGFPNVSGIGSTASFMSGVNQSMPYNNAETVSRDQIKARTGTGKYYLFS